jgi:hypothetical protein
MNNEEYRKKHFVEPQPEQRFRFVNSFGVTLYFEEFNAAITYYEKVLGPPGYVEGEGTKSRSIRLRKRKRFRRLSLKLVVRGKSLPIN